MSSPPVNNMGAENGYSGSHSPNGGGGNPPHSPQTNRGSPHHPHHHHHPHSGGGNGGMNSTNTQSIADYLAQLLKDKKQLAAFPNVFLHVERLLDDGKKD